MITSPELSVSGLFLELVITPFCQRKAISIVRTSFRPG